MDYETLVLTKKDDIITVVLNRPDVHNAMNETLIHELTRCFQQLSSDTSVVAVVLTGNGKSFCAGADLNWMKDIVKFSPEENRRDSQLLLTMYESIYNCPKPVIGRINGHAFGGGIGLLAACDISITVPEMKFAFSEVKLGIIPAVISTFVSLRISPANMRRLFITGERFDSELAHQIGLIDMVVPPEKLDKAVNACLDQVRSSGPRAIQEIKHLVDMCVHMDVKRYMDFTVEKISELRVSPEGQEGIKAFLEKRKPNWNR